VDFYHNWSWEIVNLNWECQIRRKKGWGQFNKKNDKNSLNFLNSSLVSISSTFYSGVFCTNVFLAVACKLKNLPKSTFIRKICGFNIDEIDGRLISSSYHLQSVSQISINDMSCLFFSQFWPLLKQASFFMQLGQYWKLAWAFSRNTIGKFSLPKSVKHSVGI